MTTWILITVACCLTAFAWLMGLLAPRWCSARAWLALYSGHGLMFVLLVFAAARAELQRAPSTPIIQPLVVDHERLPVADLPPAVDGDARFVASSIKQTYHLRGCRYAGMMEHARTYGTKEDAEAAGLTPCKVCLPAVESVARGE